MKVKWEQFAKRRKINLEMFKNMSYEDYCAWCTYRKVEPVPEESYGHVRNFITAVDECESAETVVEHEFNEKQLKKLKKLALEKICDDHDADYGPKDTKKSLIQKLLLMNNLAKQSIIIPAGNKARR